MEYLDVGRERGRRETQIKEGIRGSKKKSKRKRLGLKTIKQREYEGKKSKQET